MKSKVKIPVYIYILSVLFFSSATVIITKYYDVKNPADSANQETLYKMTRLSGYDFIRPLISAKPVIEPLKYYNIKKSVENMIQGYKNDGTITSASIYFRDFDESNWCSINGDQKYTCGSLLKVPELIAFLLMEEDHPGTLDRKVLYQNPLHPRDQIIKTKTIQPGHTYTIRELLQYMIEYSDNYATALLNANIDVACFRKIFTDFGLSPVDWYAQTYYLSAEDCSLFMEALFNARYLTIKNSEYAMSLLMKSDFMDGIVKGIPQQNLKIAHKFAEAGTPLNCEMHETAIMYINNCAYLLTIMTRGNNNVDHKKLEDIIQNIAHTFYDGVVNMNHQNSTSMLTPNPQSNQ